MATKDLSRHTDMQNNSQKEKSGFATPIALLNFNRPQMTRQVFEVVQKIKPRRLMLIADGPRASRPDDARLCAEVRAIFDEIDWECEVSKNFSGSNMGSFKRNSTGLNWVFETVEEAIILEDDCVPSLSFFPYCEELLERYRDDQRVGVIGGNNFDFPKIEQDSNSYFFSAYTTIWGWASWRRVWQQVDLSMPWWNSGDGKKLLRNLFPYPADWKHYHRIYENISSGKSRNAWDYQLLLTCFRHSQCGVIPRVNLVSNIGFGADATNCIEPSQWQDFPRCEMAFPLIHPVDVERSIEEDHAIFYTLNCPKPLWQRAINKLGRVAKRIKKII